MAKFAGPLKDMLRAYYKSQGVFGTELERRIEGDLKEEPCKYLNGRTPRHAMETLGTEWGRICMGDTFWIEAWERLLDLIPGTAVVDDCRFDNEAAAIHLNGGKIIKLKPVVRRRKKSSHVAEAGISDKLVDHVIVNDGTILDLQKKIGQVVGR
nr:hypothetical protein [Mesorhizobium loti]